ncbi:uncharacterized protein LOC122047316 [Zingiber officinale]|uniref:uncharacterized protein LOC122047316 n=1 Tax=Zingiber officinale TaxID=94328 RepID=UPI001C4C1940|nr:uncharacterized protein LOC122047316 [Zingiber officinale]XP_042464435.1 uncharacterized protein LOC122047316 [Zingiber officinale]
MEVDLPADLAPLLHAASEFASYPGLQNDASVKEFLDRFPLHVLLSVLQRNADVNGVEDTLVSCLDKIFRTSYGASLLPDYSQFIQAGLQANSQFIRCLSCKAVSYLLENSSNVVSSVQVIIEYNIYPLLLTCLVHGDEKTSAASLGAIQSIAKFPEGISIIFPTDGEEYSLIKNIAAQSSSVARTRILALLAKLFSLSSTVASAIYSSNLLNLFEIEINNGNDMLATLSALEILYELVESPHSSMFLLRTTLFQLLTNMISNSSVDSILRSRAALISGRILSSSEAYAAVNISSVTALLEAIDRRLKVLGSQNTDESESALEALGMTGATNQGANLLLTSSSSVAAHVVESAFDRHSRGKQLAGLHALATICGADRPENSRVLDDKAEENLRRLIYTAAANTPKLKPSGLLLSALKQEPEIRLAGYRVVSALVARRWCLTEVCSEPEIIDIVTDAKIETAKNGMDARYECCASISKALLSSNLLHDAAFADIAGKLQGAVRRGPYLTKERQEAQPLVMTAERF